jgi:hypothetical protein
MNWIRSHWSKIAAGLFVATLGTVAAQTYFGNADCCAPGAACCKPGAPCCHHSADKVSAR